MNYQDEYTKITKFFDERRSYINLEHEMAKIKKLTAYEDIETTASPWTPKERSDRDNADEKMKSSAWTSKSTLNI